MGGFGESGGGQVRLELPGCIHLENPEFPPPSIGSLRQWFRYFSSLRERHPYILIKQINPLSYPEEECMSENIFILSAQLVGHLAV